MWKLGALCTSRCDALEFEGKGSRKGRRGWFCEAPYARAVKCVRADIAVFVVRARLDRGCARLLFEVTGRVVVCASVLRRETVVRLEDLCVVVLL